MLMKKLFLTTAMLLGVYLNGEAQTITLPTTKRTKTTEKAVKQNKSENSVKSSIPTLPTIKKANVTETANSVVDSISNETPQTVPAIESETILAEKKDTVKTVVKRRKASRAKAIKRNPKVDDNEIYESAEHIPTYPGGAAALMEFIQNNLQYPEKAKSDKAEGIIQVSFVVEKDGSTSEFEVLDEHHPSLEAEAVRVLKMMPKWNPGTQDGVKIRVEYTVPVKFVLPEEEMNNQSNNIKQ